MQSVIEALREVVGIPQFYTDGAIDYGQVLEYSFGCILVLVVVASIFKILVNWSKN